MIDYPQDDRLREQARQHGLQVSVLVRDIVRVVEVLNLRAKAFFNKRSVLSGSMALRCFGSPRFTVYDADFSTSAAAVDPPASMTDMLRYSDENLDIIPAAAIAADRRETLIQIEPIRFDAAFTSIALADQDQQFKADVSFRGLLLDGREVPFATPYSLKLWNKAPTVWVMDPVEVLAEKILGWVRGRLDRPFRAVPTLRQGLDHTRAARVVTDSHVAPGAEPPAVSPARHNVAAVSVSGVGTSSVHRASAVSAVRSGSSASAASNAPPLGQVFSA
jgi:hypothetical protein